MFTLTGFSTLHSSTVLFGDSNFETNQPYHPLRRKPHVVMPFKRLGNYSRKPDKKANIIARHLDRDYYDLSGRVSVSRTLLDPLIRGAGLEMTLRKKHWRGLETKAMQLQSQMSLKSSRCDARPCINCGIEKKQSSKIKRKIGEATVQYQIARLKFLNARLARNSSEPSVNQKTIVEIRKTLDELDKLNYFQRKKLAPATIQAFKNSGTFTFNNAVYHHTKRKYEESLPAQEGVFEGMVVDATGLSHKQSRQLMVEMKQELPGLERAIALSPKMMIPRTALKQLPAQKTQKRGFKEVAGYLRAFMKTEFLNQKADIFHALSHYTPLLFSDFFFNSARSHQNESSGYSQQSRKACLEANQSFPENIPAANLEMDAARARLAYVLFKKYEHLFFGNGLHAISESQAEGLPSESDIQNHRRNKRIMREIPLFNPSYGLDPALLNYGHLLKR